MIDLKIGDKFNITFFAKKYGKFITRAGLWNEKSVEKYCKHGIEKLFTFYDLDAERYTTATGDITVVPKEDN
jgi:hypothetical protein